MPVFLNNGTIDETVVQINLNACLKMQNRYAVLFHDARITKKGASKQGLLQYVKNRNRDLVKWNSIYLGKVDCSRNLFLSNTDVSKTVSNIIEYVIYRNEYKQQFKKDLPCQH